MSLLTPIVDATNPPFMLWRGLEMPLNVFPRVSSFSYWPPFSFYYAPVVSRVWYGPFFVPSPFFFWPVVPVPPVWPWPGSQQASYSAAPSGPASAQGGSASETHPAPAAGAEELDKQKKKLEAEEERIRRLAQEENDKLDEKIAKANEELKARTRGGGGGSRGKKNEIKPHEKGK